MSNNNDTSSVSTDINESPEELIEDVDYKEETIVDKRDELKKLLNTEYVYPGTNDPDLQEKIYRKREFYYNKVPIRTGINTYNDIKDYRSKICTGKIQLLEQQAFLSNLINPNTPYQGILVFAGTGSGKCIHGDDFAYVNGLLIKAMDLWEKFNSGVLKKDNDDGGEWSIPKKELIVNCLNNNTNRIIKSKVKYLFRQPVNEKMREITLENGLKMNITNQHKLLKINGWNNKLKIGDYICIPKFIHNCPEKNYFDVIDELVYFIAWQISEGHERKNMNCLIITNNDMVVLNNLKKSIDKISSFYFININKPNILIPKNRSTYLQLYSKEYIEFLEAVGYEWGNLSAKKRIPDFIMNCSKKQIKIFLRNYFDAEASISEKRGILEITSASELIINQLMYLLRIFGINCRIKQTLKMATNGKRIKRMYYVLYISSYSLRIFNEEIKFGCDYKQKILEKVCKRKCNTNIEVIPLKDILYNLWIETRLPYRKFIFHNYIHANSSPTLETTQKIIEKLEKIINDNEMQKKYNITPKKLSLIIITKSQLENEIRKEVFYVKIAKIREYVYNGFVYDLEVDVHHNYVANGILAHNTCAGIQIAERFKEMIQKYGTKIYVLVSGPLIKETWKNELLKCTGETYIKNQDGTVYANEQDRLKARKNAINIALQFYRFMSYRSFYKKVLGEKIPDKIKTKDNKIKKTYRKTEEGEFERDIAIDRIYNLNNSLVIIDEAHNITGNYYGDSLMKIIKNSSNLKVVLMTATPMKNLADNIVELINFIRPPNDPMLRDKIFTNEKNHKMELKQNGAEYLKRMTRGYISYLRGADPLTFAIRIDKGVIPKGLFFTKVIQCKMLPFQRKLYDVTIQTTDDTLDRSAEAVANFAFPGLSEDHRTLSGYYGNEGINIVKNQLRSHLDTINKKIAQEILKDESLDNDNDSDLINVSEDGRSITGKILNFEYLKYFSIKFYKALKKLNRLVWGKKGARTAFVYSNLVKVGIDIFEQILLKNGYLQYDENSANYKIKPTTRCYYCGENYRDHQRPIGNINTQGRIEKKNSNISESSTEYENKQLETPQHTFHPATFVSVTGKSSEEAADIIPEEKQLILTKTFNNIDNIEGRFIKFVLGSAVMNEGISLRNVAEVHILDVYFNLGKVDQVIGRAIRHCSHIQLMNEQNPYPEVKVYKYAVTVDEGLSSEEELYKKAELKYLLIKKVERILKENAIDCALNINKNIFPEELKKYKDCIGPTEGIPKPGQEVCPALCDFVQCNFKCNSTALNQKYFDAENNTYRSLSKDELDYSTFTHNLAQGEINSAKNKIKELYRVKYLYTLKDIIKYVKDSYEGEKRDLFDEFFVFEALNELIPVNENDFNNFRDTIFDKYNRHGYLIFIDKYYIFQPFDQNENVPMYYRTVFDKPMQTQLTLNSYLKNIGNIYLSDTDETEQEIPIDKPLTVYDFDSVMDYYENRDEFKYVGIIDKESSRRKTKNVDELVDVFKLRDRRAKVLAKLRATGQQTYKGSTCGTARSRSQLEKIAKDLEIIIKEEYTRDNICEKIREKLLFMEKYSTGKNKLTYMITPKNHPIYKFPYNLVDRKEYIINQIKDHIKFKININVKDVKQKTSEGQNITTYIIEINNNTQLSEFTDLLVNLGFILEKNKWIININ